MKISAVGVIIFLAVVLRLGLLGLAWGQPGRLMTPDSQGYIKLADSLARCGAFEQDGVVEIFRTPGYPIFLLLTVPFGEHWWSAAAVLQIAVDALTVYLTFLLGWLLCSRKAGLIAAGLQAVLPLAVSSSVRILSDNLFAFLLLLGLLFVVFHIRTRRWAYLIVGGVVLSAACYVRPIGLAMGGLCIPILLTQPGRWARTGALAGIFAVCLGPWVVRNAVRADYIGFSSFAGESLYHFAAPALVARFEGTDPAKVREEFARQAHELDTAKTPGLAVSSRKKRAMEIIRAHPLAYLRIHLSGAMSSLLPASPDVLEVAGLTAGLRGTLDVLHREGPLAAARHYFGPNRLALVLAVLMAVILLVQYTGAAVWLAGGLRWSMPAEHWLLLAVVVVGLLAAGPSAVPRFRLPVSPIISIASAGGYQLLTALFKKPASPTP